ncbi:MAG: PAS domain S-box protein [Terracidiphilus sp.]
MKSSAADLVVHRLLPRYGLAALTLGIALGVALLLEHFHFRVPAALLLLLPVAIASWYGGRGPGVMAAILSTVTYYWFFVEPARTIYIYLSEIPHFVTFAAFAVLLSWFGAVRRRVEAGLHERAALLDLTHDTVFVMDMDGMIKYWNRGAEERYGWTAEQAVGRFVHGLLKTVFPGPIEELKAEIMRTGRWEGELRHTRKDGTQVVVASRWSLERDEQGAALAILETNNDITERKRAEEALRRLNRELRAISNCNQTLLRTTDERSLLEQICRIVCDEAGYRMAFVAYAEHDEAKSVRPVAWTGAEAGYLATAGITWADAEGGRGPTGTAIRSGKTCCIQDFATDPRLAPWREGLLQRGFRSGIAVPLKDEEGRAFGSLTIHSGQPNAFTPEEIRLLEELAGDMAFGIVNLRSQAARKQAEQEVTLLSFALANVRESALLLDDTGRVRYVNEEACRVLGFTRAQLLGMGVSDIDSDFPAERWPDHWRDLREHRSLSFESHHRNRDGRIFPVEISANYFEYGGRAYNLALVRDITERKRAEEALQESETRFRTFVDHAGDALFVEDLEQGTIVDVNRQACESLGYTRHELIGNTAAVLHLDSDRAEMESAAERVVAGETVFDRHSHRRKDGSLFPVEAHTSLVSYGGRRFLLKVTRDITDRVRAEEALRRSEVYLAEGQRLTHTGSWADDGTMQPKYWSEELFRIYEFDSQQGLPTTEQCIERVHPDDREKFVQAFDKAIHQKVDAEVEYRIVLPDGRVKLLHGIGRPMVNAHGDLLEIVGTTIDITERKRTEEALRRSEAYLAEAQKLSHTGSWAQDAASNRYDYVSEECARIFGFDPQVHTLSKEVVFRRIHPEDRDRVTRYVQESIREKVDTSVEYRALLPDGTMKHIHAIRHPVLNSAGDVIQLLGTIVDVTARKRAEEALRQSEERLRLTLESTQIGIFDWDVAHDEWYASPVYYTALGYEPREGPGDRAEWVERLHPEDRERVTRILQDILTGKIDRYEYEARLRHADGSYRWVQVKALGIEHDSDGKVSRELGVRIDITERKRAEEALLRSEAYLAEAQRLSRIGSWAYKHGTDKPSYWSDELFRIWGFDPKDGTPEAEMLRQRIHPEDRIGTFEVRDRALQAKTDFECEFRIVLPDETVKHIRTLGHPVLGGNGELIEVIGTHMDVTERKRAEEALSRSEAYLAEAQRLSRTGSFACDSATQPLYWSEEHYRIFEFCPQQGLPTQNQLLEREHPEDRERLLHAFDRIIHQKVDAEVEYRIVLPDGKVKWAHGIGHPVLNTNGELVEIVGTTVDITERKRSEQERERLRHLEAELAHIDRINILGELVASISHELNQPIAASIMNASLALQWLERDPPDLAQARQRTATIIEMGELASEIIDRLRSLYKKEPSKREPLTINDVIAEMVGLLRPQATRHAVSVRADLADSLPIVVGDRVQIQQVLMNLMLNGIEAMSDTGGVLTIRSRLREDGQIEISVNDTGPGLPAGKADQIFDAFFTTKPQGSGMGLAISKTIVESHGGSLWANGNDGRGATFHFTVPVARRREAVSRRTNP